MRLCLLLIQICHVGSNYCSAVTVQQVLPFQAAEHFFFFLFNIHGNLCNWTMKWVSGVQIVSMVSSAPEVSCFPGVSSVSGSQSVSGSSSFYIVKCPTYFPTYRNLYLLMYNLIVFYYYQPNLTSQILTHYFIPKDLLKLVRRSGPNIFTYPGAAYSSFFQYAIKYNIVHMHIGAVQNYVKILKMF